MHVEIRRNDAANRFETTVEGALCVLDYRLDGNVLAINHVGVPDAVGGRGIAGQLVKAAFDAARDQAWRVIPNCPYAAAWLDRNPEYADLRERA